jgi:CMP-N-acetylneuraminic acid synthetase
VTVFGVIPARGGSKGIPRKNIKPFGGAPLVAHTIRAALAARRLNRVIVSTDDQEIADVARRYAAEVPFLRPAEFSTDKASSISVLRHALDFWRSRGEVPDAIVLLPPTCPLREAVAIDGATELLERSTRDSVITVTPIREHPYFMCRRERDGRYSYLMDVSPRPHRRQELPALVVQTSSIAATRVRYLERASDADWFFNTESFDGYLVDYATAFDIDTPADWIVGEALLAARQAGVPGALSV